MNDFGSWAEALATPVDQEQRLRTQLRHGLQIVRNEDDRPAGVGKVVHPVQAALLELSVPDGEIEAVIAANVLEHIDERRELLQVLGRKLTPTGRLVISDPTENRLYRLGRKIVGFSGHYHVTNIHDIVEDARAVGLR